MSDSHGHGAPSGAASKAAHTTPPPPDPVKAASGGSTPDPKAASSSSDPAGAHASTGSGEHGFGPMMKRFLLRQLSGTVDATIGAIIAHFVTKDANGNISGPNMETLKKIGPHFAHDLVAGARFASLLAGIDDLGLVYSLLDFLNNTVVVGRHQRAQFIQAFAEMTADNTPESQAKATELLIWLAGISKDDDRLALAISLGFMKAKESDYLMVTAWDTARNILQGSWGWLSTRIPQASRAVGRWLADPAGFRMFVRNAAQVVDNAARTSAPYVDRAAVHVQSLAGDVQQTAGYRLARFLRIR